MNPLYVDTFEPQEMLSLILQSVPEAVQVPLNNNGFADYKWQDIEGNIRQWERKQIGELLSDLNGVEEQLNRELATCDELTLVVEGFMAATALGVLCFHAYPSSYAQHRGDKFISDGVWLTQGHGFTQPGLAQRWRSLKWSLVHCGVEVVETLSLAETALHLTTAYKQSMKEEHTTLRRYVVEHITPFSPDYHVENLIRLLGPDRRGLGIGPERAVALIEAFGTFHAAVTAPRAELNAVIGVGNARRFIKGLGRDS